MIGKLIEKNQENHLPPRKCAIILRATIEYLYRQNTSRVTSQRFSVTVYALSITKLGRHWREIILNTVIITKLYEK